MRYDPMIAAKRALRFRASSFVAMMQYKPIGCALLLASSLILTATANAQTSHHASKASKSAKASAQVLPAPAPVLEPKAIEILKAACSRLAAAHSMSFTAVISYENPSRLGPPLIYTVHDDVRLRTGRKPYRDGQRSAHDRRRVGEGLQRRRHLLSLHRRDRRRPLRGNLRRNDDRLLHRAIARDGRGYH